MRGLCTAGECDRPVHARGLCVGHYRRQARGRAVPGPLAGVSSPWRELTEAALAYADAPADDDRAWRAAARELARAARAFREDLEGEPEQTPDLFRTGPRMAG